MCQRSSNWSESRFVTRLNKTRASKTLIRPYTVNPKPIIHLIVDPILDPKPRWEMFASDWEIYKISM